MEQNKFGRSVKLKNITDSDSISLKGKSSLGFLDVPEFY